MSNVTLFDRNRPAEGSVVTGQELRELLSAIATSNAGTVEPSGDAVFIGDVRFASVSGQVRYKLSLNINGVSQVVDIRSLAGNTSQITPAEVVSAINDAFGDTVAYVYGTEASDGSSFIALVAPRSVATPSITLSNTGDGADAIDAVFGVSERIHGMPYTVTKQSAPYGMTWLKTDSNEGELRIYLGSTARATGYKNLAAGSGTVDLFLRGKLRVLIAGPSGTWPATGIPLDIDIRGSSPSATTPTEIVTAINDAFTGLAGWTGNGPASLVTRNGSGQYLQIVAGPADNPYTGPLARVELSNLSIGGPLGINFLIDDAISDVFGLPRGEGDKKFTRVPYIFKGAYFSTNYIRGVDDRRGAGIGVWGSSFDSSTQMPAAGNLDGEVRVAKDTSIPWVYRQSEGGWRRLMPGYTFPLKYSKSRESYEVTSTADTFVPHPLNYIGYDQFYNRIVDENHDQTGDIGAVVTLTDGRDPAWLVASYTDGRDPTMLEAVYDNFRITGNLNRTWHGIRWNTYESSSSAATKFQVGVTGTVKSYNGLGSDPIRSVLDGAGSVVQLPTPSGFVSGGTYTQTIPNVSASAPIRAGTVHVWITVFGGDQASLGGSPPESYKGFDNGSGVIGGTGLSGTINYTTGVITLNSLTMSSSYRVSVAYSQNAANEVFTVCADVRLAPGTRVSYDDTPAQAGLIYKAHSVAGSSSIDPGSGFAVVIDDGGVGRLYSIDNHVPTAIGTPFIVDPPLDENWRTLRVVFTQAGSDTVHTVVWNGSNKPSDWLTKDYASPEAGLSSSETSGGLEVDRAGKILTVQTIPTATISGLGGTHNLNITGHLPGLWALGVPTDGGLIQKQVEIANFQQHGGQKKSILNPSPALAPVSAVRLRDTINAVRVLSDGSPIVGADGLDRIITDCTAAAPLELNIVGDLRTNLDVSSNSDITGRRITMGYSVPAVLKNKDDRYLYAAASVPDNPGYLSRNNLPNINGRVARWSLSQMIVSPAALILAGQTASYKGGYPIHMFDLGTRADTGSFDFSSGGLPFAYWAPGTSGWEITSLGGTDWSKWNRNVTNGVIGSWPSAFKSFSLSTTLPRNGHNGINWVYKVTRFEVAVHRSKVLESAWSTQSTAGLWWANSQVVDPYNYTISQEDSISALPQYTGFEVVMAWAGPVRPARIHIDIEAYRVGTED